jgi:hypothetical protein
MTRAEKVWSIRKFCIRANGTVLWNDHGDILKRVISQGVAVPTKIGLDDVLLTWRWVYGKQGEHDEDALQVAKEVSEEIQVLWDMHADDLTAQSDTCIDYIISAFT